MRRFRSWINSQPSNLIGNIDWDQAWCSPRICLKNPISVTSSGGKSPLSLTTNEPTYLIYPGRILTVSPSPPLDRPLGRRCGALSRSSRSGSREGRSASWCRSVVGARAHTWGGICIT